MENTTAPQPKFKRGDVVHLNSNPEIRMTVRTVDRNTGTVECNWFQPDMTMLGGELDEYCLTLVVKQSPPAIPVPPEGFKLIKGKDLPRNEPPLPNLQAWWPSTQSWGSVGFDASAENAARSTLAHYAPNHWFAIPDPEAP